MPGDCKVFLPEIFTDTPVQLYYSVYSTVPEWRRRWIPKAWSARYGMEQMKMWQEHSGQLITLHFAVIEGQNDAMDVLEDLVHYVRCENLRVKFNLVRYNPYSEKQGKEPELDKLEEIFEYYNRAFQGEKNRIVPRVGFDVKASCGMFVDTKQVD
jgi:adenine C2-methylase RlmN of 23S rRNA A2503 and tRNA A37